MNADDFEKRLQRQPLRPVPKGWRAEILSAARNVTDTEHATRSLLSTLNAQLSTLLWPSPHAWAGLAAVWVVILAVNFATSGDSQPIAKRVTPFSPEMLMAIQIQAEVGGKERLVE